MKSLPVILTAVLILVVIAATAGCAVTETPTPTLTPAVSPTPTPELLPTPIPTPEEITTVPNITRTLSGLSITLVSATWINDEVEIQWRIENPLAQSFKASRLYNMFQPGMLATDQSGKEAEYFIPAPITKDLEPGKFLIFKTRLLFYPDSAQITIRLSDVYNEGSVFVDISTEFTFPR
jgi:hypothetical protein